jgi:hypothetical protein
MPDRPRAPEYGDDFIVRRVSTDGRFAWQGTLLRAGSASPERPDLVASIVGPPT